LIRPLALRELRLAREIDISRVLCKLEALRASGCQGFSVGEGDWPLKGFAVLLGNGEVRGYANWCPHQGHPLNLRPNKFLTPDGAAIICASHGAIFARDNGLCLAGPCPGKSLRDIPLKVEDGYVLLHPSVDIAAIAASIERL
jgi:nitrite reductase/ring-hydroxylating ferredoxin subunit